MFWICIKILLGACCLRWLSNGYPQFQFQRGVLWGSSQWLSSWSITLVIASPHWFHFSEDLPTPVTNQLWFLAHCIPNITISAPLSVKSLLWLHPFPKNMRIPLLSSTSPVNPSRFPQKIPWNFLIPSHVLHPHQDLDAALRPGEDPGEAPRRNSATKTGMITGWLVGFKGVEWNWTQQKMNMIPYWSWGNLDKQWQYHVQLCVYNIYIYLQIHTCGLGMMLWPTGVYSPVTQWDHWSGFDQLPINSSRRPQSWVRPPSKYLECPEAFSYHKSIKIWNMVPEAYAKRKKELSKKYLMAKTHGFPLTFPIFLIASQHCWKISAYPNLPSITYGLLMTLLPWSPKKRTRFFAPGLDTRRWSLCREAQDICGKLQLL